jgi:hypothetical protein
MDLNLIPPTQQKKPKIKKGKIGALALKKAKEPQKLIYIIIFIVGVVSIVGFYGIVKSYESSLKKKIVRFEEEQNELKIEIIKLKEEIAVTDFQAKLNILGSVIESHVSWDGVLEFLEEFTLPKVRYKSFSSSGQERLLRLSGATTNFTSLAEQVTIFKNHELIESFKLTGFNIAEGGISFSMEIKLSQEAWEGGNKKDES